MTRAWRVSAWLVPPLACVALYWYGLITWFHQDDFAWLGQRLELHSTSDLWRILFAPKAQGTIRPWSERLFFLLFYSWFGLDPLPFRVWAFLTQFVNLWLAGAIARRLTGWTPAATLAPLLWLATFGLSTPMGWSSSYNQLLCACFLLAAFWFLLRAIETGSARYWVAQWVTFIVGFGSLEIAIVYPALAALYTFLFARSCFRRTLPMFLPSVLYFALHSYVAAKPVTGPYAPHWDLGILRTYWQYCAMTLTSAFVPPGLHLPGSSWRPVSIALVASLLIYTAYSVRRRDWTPLFGIVWFTVVIAPVLPLKDHVTEYYVTIPAIGLAWAASAGLRDAWRSGWAWRGAALLVTATYLLYSVPAARFGSKVRYLRARAVQGLVRGVERAHALHPDKMILLTGLTSDQFWIGMYDGAFRLFGADQVFLAPGAADAIDRHPELGNVEESLLPESIAARALNNRLAVVYQVEGYRLRNVTRRFERIALESWRNTAPRQVDVGQKAYAGQLGPTWHPLEGGYRWMPREASLRMAAPSKPGEKLWLSGFCPESHLLAGPVELSISVNKLAVGWVTVTRLKSQFEAELPLPESLLGLESMEVELRLNRTVREPGGGRELGLVFGRFALR